MASTFAMIALAIALLTSVARARGARR
jgi:hypothetical protein